MAPQRLSRLQRRILAWLARQEQTTRAVRSMAHVFVVMTNIARHAYYSMIQALVVMVNTARHTYQALRKLGDRLGVWGNLTSIASLILAIIVLIWSPGNNPVVVFTSGPHGEISQKATLTGFEKELKEASAEKESEARDYFKAAERDFAAHRYREATNNYQKSLGSLSTMSAYLNLGGSLEHRFSNRS